MSEKTKELLTKDIKQAITGKQAAAVLDEPEKEQVQEKLRYSAHVKIGTAIPPDTLPYSNRSRNATIGFFQKSYGNLATFRHVNYPIQAKLKVSHPNDPYEQEADRVADHIMRMP